MQKKTYILPVVVSAAAFLALFFRVFQLLVVVDYGEMGFFDTAAGFVPTVGLYLLLVLAAVFLVMGAIIDKKHESSAFTRPSAGLSSKQTAVLGFAFLIGACLRFYELVFKFKGFDLNFCGEALLFVLFTAIGFIILARRELRPVVGYLHIVICISYTLKAAALFMQDTIIIRVSDELLLLLSYVASVLFFLALGRFISRNESKLTRYKLLVFGSFTATLSLCASLAGYIALLVDSAHMNGHMTMHPLAETGSGIIALALIMTMYGSVTPPAENGEEQEEEQDEDDGYRLSPD